MLKVRRDGRDAHLGLLEGVQDAVVVERVHVESEQAKREAKRWMEYKCLRVLVRVEASFDADQRKRGNGSCCSVDGGATKRRDGMDAEQIQVRSQA